MSKRYIHYGSSNFDKKRINIITSRPLPNKPSFGLWASPIDSTYRSWEEWCRDEEYELDKLEEYFTFTLTNDAKILEIREPSDIKRYEIEREFEPIKTIDYDSIIADGYDGVELYMNNELYWYLYGWDCDSIVIFNPNVVIQNNI